MVFAIENLSTFRLGFSCLVTVIVVRKRVIKLEEYILQEITLQLEQINLH